MNDEKKKILIIEDEEDTAIILKDSLQAAGFRITVAHSGMEGIIRAREIAPDLITLDIKMPGVGGLNFLKRISADEMLNKIPVIVISSFDIEYKRESIKLGATDFLQKPIDFKELARTIKKILKLDQ
ncbi:MAG: response regulator [Elusimicrobia bacterium]|nr:response regulator [Elusimicrobiota bacterium]